MEGINQVRLALIESKFVFLDVCFPKFVVFGLDVDWSLYDDSSLNVLFDQFFYFILFSNVVVLSLV